MRQLSFVEDCLHSLDRLSSFFLLFYFWASPTATLIKLNPSLASESRYNMRLAPLHMWFAFPPQAYLRPSNSHHHFLHKAKLLTHQQQPVDGRPPSKRNAVMQTRR